MRITLDTNILISVLIFNSKTLNTLLYHVILDHTLVFSTYITDELKLVVKRKFPEKTEDIEDFLATLPFELNDTPKNIDKTLFDIRDEKDYPVLYTALIGNIDILITGDKDFADIAIEKPEILTPAQFMKKYY